MSDTDTDGSDEEGARMTAVCKDGTRIGCTNFEAIDGGVLLTEDLKRKRVFGFVPNDELRYVLPTETADRVRREGTGDEFEDPLMRLPGVGSTYAKRLRDAGYASVGELADADPDALAEATGANRSRTTEWVERAGGTRRADGARDGEA